MAEYTSIRELIALAINQMYKERNTNMSETRDFVGASYDAVVLAATASYWVAPISTDNSQFHAHWKTADHSTTGLVHYEYQDWDSGERPYHKPD